MKQRLSRWIVDAIVYRPGLCLSVLTVSYSSEGPEEWPPPGLGPAASHSEICEAASWSSRATFTRFYNLDVPALQAQILCNHPNPLCEWKGSSLTLTRPWPCDQGLVISGPIVPLLTHAF